VILHALLLSLALQAQPPVPSTPAAPAAPGAPEKITEIRVHGNATISDAVVIQLAGLTVGTTLDPNTLADAEKRLRTSGRFDDVEVRKRYRTLAMDDVAIVLLVHEKPGVTVTGQPPSTFRKIRNHLMYFPIVYYDDGYGWTYGARTSFVNVAGKGTHIAVPLTWGADKHAALEVDRTFNSGPFTHVLGSYGILEHENPYYNVDDQRVTFDGRLERRLFDRLILGAEMGRQNIDFGPTYDRIWTTTFDATLDTRRDPKYPVDAAYTGVSWTRLHSIGVTSFSANGDAINKTTYDLRGFKRLFGQNVLALHLQYDTANAPLPEYERPLIEGFFVRSAPTGTFAGDKRLLWSGELRFPISSPLSTGRIGVNAFYDAGTVAPFGQSVLKQKAIDGVGGGVWLIFTVIQLNFNVAHSLNGTGTRFNFGTGFSF
jgi:outer membrane protein assembly factor BamA